MAILIFHGVGDEFDVKVVFGYFDKERSDFGFALLPVYDKHCQDNRSLVSHCCEIVVAPFAAGAENQAKACN